MISGYPEFINLTKMSLRAFVGHPELTKGSSEKNEL
jgi:hypothetical protein